MSKTLSQTQIIRSLGQALEWFQKETAWGVSAGELNHLTGRIGELYAAMITRGQMALATNQRGYDVVSHEGEYISVKTVTTSNSVQFRESTFAFVDRVIVLRINIEDDDISIEELLDCPAMDIRERSKLNDGKYTLSISSLRNQIVADASNGDLDCIDDTTAASRTVLSPSELKKLKILSSANFECYRISQFENASILIEKHGSPVQPAKPVLRDIARKIGVDIENSSGNLKNTRSLGADIIKTLTA